MGSNWKLYDAQGYEQAVGVEVFRYPETAGQCEQLRVGRSLYRADEIEVITDTEIVSSSGWRACRSTTT